MTPEDAQSVRDALDAEKPKRRGAVRVMPPDPTVPLAAPPAAMGGLLDAKPRTYERRIKRAAFHQPVFEAGKGARSMMSWLAGPVTVTPVGLERMGVLVTWGNISCLEWE